MTSTCALSDRHLEYGTAPVGEVLIATIQP
jgi:hypothetical protein